MPGPTLNFCFMFPDHLLIIATARPHFSSLLPQTQLIDEIQLLPFTVIPTSKLRGLNFNDYPDRTWPLLTVQAFRLRNCYFEIHHPGAGGYNDTDGGDAAFFFLHTYHTYEGVERRPTGYGA